MVAISALLSMWSSAKPVKYVGGIGLSIGGLNEWALFTALAVVLVVSGAIVGWTTPLGEIAPALSRLGRPLRWVRLPVDEWVIAIALAIRCLPLLIEEIRMLGAARRLRAQPPPTRESPRAAMRAVLAETHDLLSTAIVVSIRRARDLADAIVARGGLDNAGNVPGRAVPRRRRCRAARDDRVVRRRPDGVTSLTCNTFASAAPASKSPESASAR